MPECGNSSTKTSSLARRDMTLRQTQRKNEGTTSQVTFLPSDFTAEFSKPPSTATRKNQPEASAREFDIILSLALFEVALFVFAPKGHLQPSPGQPPGLTRSPSKRSP